MLAGEYTVEIARPGYQTETRTVSIAARATETLDVPLVRVLASVFFVTEPAGVEIWIDGELKATTSGSLAPELYEEVRARGIDPARASARTEVANLSLGSHAVELRRKCYETVKRTLDTTQPQDYASTPCKMEDSLASLRLTSDPPGARILLNGEARGVTPAQIDGICSGKVRVEVKHAAGKFIKDLVLDKDEAISLDCPIRPTLAFLGVEAASAAGAALPRRRRGEDPAEPLAAHLAQLHRRPARGGRPPPRAGQAHPAGAAARLRHRPRPRAQGDRAAGRAPSRCRASSWPCCPTSGCSGRRGCTCWPPGTPRPRRWT